MAVLKQIKKLIQATDFFYSTELLRYDDELQYKTMTGGLVSLAIIITITIGFASMILDTLDLNTFNITTEYVKNPVPTSSIIQINEQSPFRFAVQIWRHNLTDPKRYFDITFRLDYQNYGLYNTTTYFPLHPCTKDYFKNYPEITDNFQTLQSETWLCPSLNTTLQLKGKYSSANFNQYVIQASACKNETDPSRPCATPQQIQKYFQQKSNFFYFVIYFTNIQINPDKKDYKHYYIEDQSYALFGGNLGSEVFLQFTDFTVRTDYSIWPYSAIVADSGCFAQNIGINRPFQTNINGTYISWSFTKSTNSVFYYRQAQKLSMICSFMGGMIGAISALLFIIKVYTNVAFQFSIAFEIFTPQDLKVQNPLQTEKVLQIIDEKLSGSGKCKKQHRKKALEQMSMNFLTFLKFYSYKVLDALKIKYNSPEMKYAQQCRQQIVKQLDIKKILKRIIFIEHCLTKILDDYHLDILQLKKPETPEEIRQIRLKCESIVDQQLLEEENIENQKTTFYDLKQVDGIQENLAETPTELNKPICRNSKIINEANVTYFHFKKEKSPFDLKNELIVLNMDEIREEKREQQESTFQTLDNTKKNIQKEELFKKKRKRESHLVQLLNTAEEGNEISNRLWKKLDKQTKRRAVRYSKLEFDV